MGQYCNRSGQAEPLYERLRQVLGELAPPWTSAQPVRWEIANCLSMCGAGPNLIIYPDGQDYHHVDADTLEQILNHYLQSSTFGEQQP